MKCFIFSEAEPHPISVMCILAVTQRITLPHCLNVRAETRIIITIRELSVEFNVLILAKTFLCREPTVQFSAQKKVSIVSNITSSVYLFLAFLTIQTNFVSAWIAIKVC